MTQLSFCLKSFFVIVVCFRLCLSLYVSGSHSGYPEWLDIALIVGSPMMFKLFFFPVAAHEGLEVEDVQQSFAALFPMMHESVTLVLLVHLMSSSSIAHSRNKHQCAIAPSAAHVRFHCSVRQMASSDVILCAGCLCPRRRPRQMVRGAILEHNSSIVVAVAVVAVATAVIAAALVLNVRQAVVSRGRGRE